MGYTHYFPQNASVSQEAWDKITADVNKTLKALQDSGIAFESNDSSGVMVTADYINFNGLDDEGHETFYVTRNKMSGFNFCKTARKPYDMAVMSALLLLEHHAPGSFNVSSDGWLEEWEDGIRFNHKLFGYANKFPEAVAGRDEEKAQELENSL